MRIRVICLLAAGCVAASVATASSAAEYVYGSWSGPNNAVLTQGVVPYFAALEKDTQGSMQWKVLAGGQLFGGPATLAGIRDRIADAGGPIIPAFTRKALRAVNVVYDLVNASESPVVMAGAVAETFHLGCPQCQADYKKNNVVFIANYSTTRFNMLCRDPIAKLADAKGRKMRVVGALGRFVKSVGAVPVGGSPAAAVEALQRGSMDCVVGPFEWLKGYGLFDITKHVLDAPLALQPTPASLVINRDVWRQFSKAERAALIRRAPSLVAGVTIRGYMAEDTEVRAEAAKRGITVTEASAEARQALESHKAAEPKVIAQSAKAEGVEDPEVIISTFLANVAKWEKIHARIGDDPEAFAGALWDEVFSKLDPEKM
ncbi:MAG: C4-dicarboxylate TRAP transporter substrate-binding protein [Burkholderiales bacterium]|nr:MAG: C4-dicarboxylate TRAP transporter substrate-binding protein [Burkholderiales bacterium]